MIFPLKPPVIGNFQFHSTGICANLRLCLGAQLGQLWTGLLRRISLRTLTGHGKVGCRCYGNRRQLVNGMLQWLFFFFFSFLFLLWCCYQWRGFPGKCNEVRTQESCSHESKVFTPRHQTWLAEKNPFSSMIFQAAPHLMTPRVITEINIRLYISILSQLYPTHIIYMYYKLYPNHSPIAIISQS